MNFFDTMSKTALAMTLGASLVGGCNQEELTQTKEQLIKVSAERDKIQTTLQAQVDLVKKDLDAANAKIADAEKRAADCAAAAAPAGQPVDPAAAAKMAAVHPAHHAGKAPPAAAGKIAPAAPKQDASAPAGSATNAVKVGNGRADGL
jgi:hypothetical protein